MKTLFDRMVTVSLSTAAVAIVLAAGSSARSAESDPAGPATDAAGTPEAILATRPATGALPADYQPSASLSEIVKLAQAGVGEEVLLSYIRNSNKAFNPTSEDIIFLNDLGVSEAVLKAIINSSPGSAAARPAPAVVQQPPVEPAPVAASAAVVAPAVVDAAPGTAVIVTQPAQVATVSYFYDSLSPYGTWVYIGGYGWCWQPTVAVVAGGWRPYCDRGRWVDSDCGWYWQSDYSWGWAAFHYGRWHHHARIGWVWMPDTVWGPSWVSWRHSDAYCGWAPLPPAAHYRPGFGFSYHDGRVAAGFEFGLSFSFYNFVPIGRFCDRSPRSHIVAVNQTKVVYNNTTVINNYYTGNNNTVINHGVARDKIAVVTKTPITRVTIKDAPSHHSGGAERIARDNGRDVIYRPTLAKANVQRVTEDLRRPRSAPPAPVPAGPTVANTGNKGTGKSTGTPNGSLPKGNNPQPVVAPASPVGTPAVNPSQAKARSNNERLNQLIDEAKAKSREREAAKRAPAVSQPQTQQPVAKTAPVAPPSVQPQEPVRREPAVIRKQDAPRVERQQSPVTPYPHRTPNGSAPAPAQQGGPQSQYRGEPAHQAPAQSGSRGSSERGNSGSAGRENSKGNSTGKGKNDN